MIEKISKAAKNCIETLLSNGFEAYIVGGAVRDTLMGIMPQDFDVTTNAKPEDVIKLFKKTVPTGIEHGTVTVIIDNENIEVTTFRNDGKYSDHRSPESVKFVSNIDDDLSRRDFTVNAICYNPKTDIYDPLCGRKDIDAKVIRAIGNANERYNEDALRIMRAFRFAAQLGFKLEKQTYEAAISSANLLESISRERIFIEFKKALCSMNATAINPLITNGGLEFLNIPSKEIPKAVELLPKNFAFRFAFMAKELSFDAKDVLTALKSDRKTITDTFEFSKLLSSPLKTRADIKIMLKSNSLDNVKTFLQYKENEKLSELEDILKQNEPYNLSMLKISGNDIEKLGFKGKEIGEILEKILLLVIDNPKQNEKENLIHFVSKNF